MVKRSKRLVVLGAGLAAIASLVVWISGSLWVAAIPYGSGAYGSCAYGGTGCSISLSSTGTVSLSLQPTANGTYSIARDQVTVTTADPSGYDLSIASADSGGNTSLVSGSNSIPASTGSPAAPEFLSMNTWGYRLDGQAMFGNGPTTAVTNAPNSNLSFAGLLPNNQSQSIYTSATSSASGGDQVNVWYGVLADTLPISGSYSQTVVYTAVSLP